MLVRCNIILSKIMLSSNDLTIAAAAGYFDSYKLDSLKILYLTRRCQTYYDFGIPDIQSYENIKYKQHFLYHLISLSKQNEWKLSHFETNLHPYDKTSIHTIIVIHWLWITGLWERNSIINFSDESKTPSIIYV